MSLAGIRTVHTVGPLGSPTLFGHGRRDDFHPNDAGHASIADLLWQAMLAQGVQPLGFPARAPARASAPK